MTITQETLCSNWHIWYKEEKDAAFPKEDDKCDCGLFTWIELLKTEGLLDEWKKIKENDARRVSGTSIHNKSGQQYS
jgi:hypothetical protein